MTPVILMTTDNKARFSGLANGLEKQINADIHWAASGNDALEAAERLSPLLAVIDENLSDMSGLEFTRELLKQNAMIYTALASSLSQEDFHETSEGLGVLVQLPVSPGMKDADEIISALKRVYALPSD